MRFLFPVIFAIAATASAQAATPPSPMKSSSKVAGSECPVATPYLAHKGGEWQGKPLRPQKLNELPPAETIAAVVRTDERGCLVLVKYPPSRR
ncbi:MAG TPA: hypothetical protein VNJ05_01240 [Sphingomicrobium sp.]|nr:hypothetical protein [Sphingomicrobium sp.]